MTTPSSAPSASSLRRLVQDHLECPVCCQTPREPPIFQCENGHLICKVCRNRMSGKCPQGQCPLEERRSLLAEKLLEGSDLARSCKYSGKGCQEEASLPKLVRHESQCQFREVPCPELDCLDDGVPAGDVLAHLAEEHYFKKEEIEQIPEKRSDECLWVVSSDDLRVRTISGTWPLSIWKWQDLVFLSILKKQRGDKLWYAWLYVVASPEVAERLTATVTASAASPSAQWPQAHFQFKGKVHAIDTPESDVILSSAALVLTDKAVEALMAEMPKDGRKDNMEEEDDELKYLLKISYAICDSQKTN